MRTPLALAAALLAFSACGSSVCTRVGDQKTRIFGTKTKCEYTEGGSTLSVSIDQSSVSQCEASLSKCGSADTAIVNEWLGCIEGVPACTAGNEKASVDATIACAAKLFDTSTGTPKVSTECLQAFN